ncbi:MAG TPA: OmpH family outer membrane protein [Bryobacteraceae bacterium]|nr:OmpH family outer membrane protein [Bryobacteraceae bacterium]
MKKSYVVLSALVLGMAAMANAQTAAPTKVAIIHIQQAIVTTKDGQKAQADLGAKFGPVKTELEKKQSEIAALQDQLKKGAATMSDEAKTKIAKDIETLNKELTRKGEDYDAEVQQEEGKVMNDLGQKMLDVVGKYAAQNGFAMVLDVSNQQTVLWADPSVNITAECIKLYDQAHPGAGAAAPKTPTGGAGPATAKPAATPPPAAPKSTPPPAPQTKKQ